VGDRNNKKQLWTNEFMVSAWPALSSSTATGIKEHTFSFITSFIQITNTGLSGNLGVAATANGFNTNNSYTILPGASFALPISVISMFVSGAAGQPYSFICGLTNLTADKQNAISQSNGYALVG
jgi:hypothetical protein